MRRIEDLLGELILTGEPARFGSTSTENSLAIRDLLAIWSDYLKAADLGASFTADTAQDIHGQVLAFLRSVAALAAHPDTGQRAVQKSAEFFNYLTSKCAEQGTALESWTNGIALPPGHPDAQRVMLVVVREIIGHVMTMARETRPDIGDWKGLLQIGPVEFITSIDDHRERRDYFYYGDDTAMVGTHFGPHLLVDLKDLSLTPTIVKTGWWEPWLDIMLRSLLKPGMTYVNCGANIGYHTNLGAFLVEDAGHVYSFEANPHAYGLLKKSIYFNGFANRSSLFNAGVFDENGTRKFHFVREMLGGGGLDAPLKPQQPKPENAPAKKWVRPPRKDGKHELTETFRYTPDDFTHIETPIVTLDEAVGMTAQTIDFLHMDIEGSEGPALLGARELIGRSPNLQMIIEWSFQHVKAPDFREKFRQAHQMLVDEKFKFYVVEPPKGNVYVEPPELRRIDPAETFDLGHCDLFLTRS